MFRGPDQIQPIVGRLLARDVSLWHACQLIDFRSYLDIGGIPSRSLLEQAELPYTGFVTDATDRSHGTWSKVFVNLTDFGAVFAHGYDAIPNPYGPIVFQIHPGALARASEVAITLRSAGAHDFDREGESLATTADLERLFRFPSTAPFPHRIQVLLGEGLRSAFAPQYPEATAPEISLTMEPELIPLDAVVAVWVDPLEARGAPLLDLVLEATDGLGLRVRRRYVVESRQPVIRDIARYLRDLNGPPTLRTLAGRADVDAATRAWATAVLSRDLDWQFRRYATYLLAGTTSAVPSVIPVADTKESRTRASNRRLGSAGT
jgi:hypothetical protein